MPEFVLPEFTRSLRALAVASAPGSDHDRVFAPLLQARTLAHRAQGIEGQLAAFDPARLEREWRAAIATLAEARHGGSPADRRALEAELDALAAPLWAALGALRRAGSALRVAPVAERAEAWRGWTGAVQGVFRAADAWWESALPVLADARGRRGGFWRRVLRRGR